MKSEDLFFHSLKAISPIDGRHRLMTESLADWLSEYALFKYRIHIEVEYLIALSENSEFTAVRQFTIVEKAFLRNIVYNFSLNDAQIIQNIDRFGYKDMKPTNHDFKAAEYFIKSKLNETSLKDISEMIHFGLTTEDANNLAYNCMINGAVKLYYIPTLVNLLDQLEAIAEKEKNTPMLGRTHGQPATPTTFGKEIANYLDRLRKALNPLYQFKLPGKLNGAVGNHAAQYFAAQEVDWIRFSECFITKLGFEPNLLTTQIEPHDGFTLLFCYLTSINNILRDLATNLWLYISLDYIVQKKVSSEVGSSTMPHKINPWRLEVAEGSTAESNAKLLGFIWKLQISRYQRDLSDHEAQRAIGVGISHSYLGILHILEELGRLQVNQEKMFADLNDRGDILTEAVQTLLRKEGYDKPYELMKDFSRGKTCTTKELHDFINNLDIKEEIKDKIRLLKPENYIGLSKELVEIAVKKYQYWKSHYIEPIIPVKKIIFDYQSCFKEQIKEDELKVLTELKNKEIILIGLNVPDTNKDIFSKIININEIIQEKDTVFVGQVSEKNNSFIKAKEKKLTIINYPYNYGEKSEYNITNLSEIIDIVNDIKSGGSM